MIIELEKPELLQIVNTLANKEVWAIANPLIYKIQMQMQRQDEQAMGRPDSDPGFGRGIRTNSSGGAERGDGHEPEAGPTG